ncbi:hypothetical protein ACGFNU_09230 [Spirillospora sp. NPDC048911]|uniref:hypothetical protein n=1 Tax=Spirillospora sp. NPDC048911 TaxID=3364527 RepID=UPI0037124B24
MTVIAGTLGTATVISLASPAYADDVWRPSPLAWTWPDRGFRDVEVVGAKDAWAAGSQGKVYVAIPGDLGHAPITLVDIGAKPMLQHWNGTSWKSYSPPGISAEGEITDVEAVSSDNVWASGFIGYRGITKYLAHWDGTTWTQVDSPSSHVSAQMWADSKGLWLKDRDALHHYANGTWTRHSMDGRYINYVLQSPKGDLYAFSEDKISHWNGSSWTTFDHLPGDRTDYYYAATADGLWATIRANSDDAATAVRRWTGTAWAAVPLPQPFQRTWSQSIYDLDGPVVEFRELNSTIYHQLRWNGTSWEELSEPAKSMPANPVVAGDGSYWADGGGSLYRLVGKTWTPVQMPIGGYLRVTTVPGTRYLFAWGENQKGELATTTNAP